jgi:hypothetical protein
MKLLQRLWLSLREGTAYKQLEEKGQWATWQRPAGSDRGDQAEDSVRRPEEPRD